MTARACFWAETVQGKAAPNHVCTAQSLMTRFKLEQQATDRAPTRNADNNAVR